MASLHTWTLARLRKQPIEPLLDPADYLGPAEAALLADSTALSLPKLDAVMFQVGVDLGILTLSRHLRIDGWLRVVEICVDTFERFYAAAPEDYQGLYMFWEGVIFNGGIVEPGSAARRRILELIRGQLQSPIERVQLAALHGLNHIGGDDCRDLIRSEIDLTRTDHLGDTARAAMGGRLL